MKRTGLRPPLIARYVSQPPMKITHSDWCLETAGWAIDHSDECITLTPADVDAALQVGTYRKRSGNVTPEELREFARRDLNGRVADALPIHCGSFSGFTSEYIEESKFWRRWWLARNSTHLFVTYNTDSDNREAHRAVVDWMLSTLCDV